MRRQSVWSGSILFARKNFYQKIWQKRKSIPDTPKILNELIQIRMDKSIREIWVNYCSWADEIKPSLVYSCEISLLPKDLLFWIYLLLVALQWTYGIDVKPSNSASKDAFCTTVLRWRKARVVLGCPGNTLWNHRNPAGTVKPLIHSAEIFIDIFFSPLDSVC